MNSYNIDRLAMSIIRAYAQGSQVVKLIIR